MPKNTLYSALDFHTDLDTDLWVLEKFDWLPQNREPYTEKIGNETRVYLFDDISLEGKQGTIKEYRKQLSSAIFALTQKVYAELFRLVLAQSNCPSGKADLSTQKDVEDTINIILGAIPTNCSKDVNKLISKVPAALTYQPVFSNQADFSKWWQGQYDYSQLRRTRNQVMHDKYSYVNNVLEVLDDNNVTILQWTADDIHKFANEVRSKAQTI